MSGTDSAAVDARRQPGSASVDLHEREQLVLGELGLQAAVALAGRFDASVTHWFTRLVSPRRARRATGAGAPLRQLREDLVGPRERAAGTRTAGGACPAGPDDRNPAGSSLPRAWRGALTERGAKQASRAKLLLSSRLR